MLHLRSAIEIAILVAVPVVMAICALFKIQQAALLTLVVAIAAVVIMLTSFETSRPRLREVMPSAVLGALAAALRIAFAAIPDVKPVSAVCIIAGIVFGKRAGFMVGALAALLSNIFFGQGPWTPWQMYAWGLIGYCAGVIGNFAWRDGRPPGWLVLVYGCVSGLLFGFVLNSWYIVGFVNPITWQSALAAYGAGIPFDVTHSVATVVFLAVLYLPWERKLRRVATKYALR